ncbi:MAG: tripartite tricarboxylate transporter substrate binding protein [Syntrophaceae bacterium]|nr:tripartite tricarboxylate transporter substrate binding protein [Syntrophaceae bacterium]
MKKALWISAVLVLALAVIPLAGGFAQDAKYPNKPVKMIVPFGAGGGTDTMVRAYQKYIDLGGQPMVVVNIAGGAGSIGVMETYYAKPDGYTIVCTGWQSMLSYYVSNYVKVPVAEEMIPIATTVSDPDVIAVVKNSPFKDVNALVKYAKANPGKLKWGSVGAVGSNYAASMLVWRALGINVTYVPFDSAAKSRAALLGGHIDVLLCQVSEINPVAQSGDALPILVTTRKRSEFLPNCPSMGDIKAKEEFTLYRGFWAPPKTPKPIIDYLEKAFSKVHENPEFRKFIMNDLKYSLMFAGSKETRDILNRETPELTILYKEALKNKAQK